MVRRVFCLLVVFCDFWSFLLSFVSRNLFIFVAVEEVIFVWFVLVFVFFWNLSGVLFFFIMVVFSRFWRSLWFVLRINFYSVEVEGSCLVMLFGRSVGWMLVRFRRNRFRGVFGGVWSSIKFASYLSYLLDSSEDVVLKIRDWELLFSLSKLLFVCKRRVKCFFFSLFFSALNKIYLFMERAWKVVRGGLII